MSWLNVFKRTTEASVIQYDYGPIDVRLKLNGLSDEQIERLKFAYSYYEEKLKLMADWVFASREHSNFTYDVSQKTIYGIAGAISVATRHPIGAILGYIEELYADRELAQAITDRFGPNAPIDLNDRSRFYGRRIGWYAVARATKPKVVVETGVDAGLGSLVLASALKRNTSEGYPGHHYGTDINPKAGFLVHGAWSDYSTILYGDSLKTLKAFDEPVGVFINDSDHSASYEGLEYREVQSKLTPDAIVLGDNAHVTDELYKWSVESGRQYLFCAEAPSDHWYPGAGIGVSFVA